LKLKEDETRQLLQPLIKPLLKLERAVAAKQGPSVDIKTLRNLVDTPTDAVLTGQRFAIEQLLNVLEQALATGTLELLERKRRKAEETIQAVKEGALDKARDEYLTLQANIQETLRQLKSKGLLDKKDELNQQLAEAHSQIEAIKARQKELQRRIEDMRIMISKLKTSIESQISKIAHESVTIRTD
jgi:chromosome segregation ATPase